MKDLKDSLKYIEEVEVEHKVAGVRFHTSRSMEIGIKEAAQCVASVLEDDVEMLAKLDEIKSLKVVDNS